VVLRGAECELVHKCAAQWLLQRPALGNFRGPVTGAVGTAHFEPGGVAFPKAVIGGRAC